jgi:hypothetical protein
MAGDPTVPFEVLTKGFEVSGDVRSGYKAIVPYLMAWEDAFTFADQVVGFPSATVIGAVTFRLPYLFPGAQARIYCQRFRIEPCGADGTTPIPTRGLKPGEFFTHAKVTLEFETPPAIQQLSDDPYGLNQLDPANPIGNCEQSVKLGGKMQTYKGGNYKYESDGMPVNGDVAILIVEGKLVLRFPRIPYLAWQTVQPYVNKVNQFPVLGVDMGTLLLEGMDTEVRPAPNSQFGAIAQSITLEFAWQNFDWNLFPRPDGTLDFIALSGTGERPYEYMDFRVLLNQLAFVGG